MINIVKTKLENKTDKQFIYYIGSSKIILDPGIPVIINGDIFTRETRQEGNTENLVVNVYNGLIDLTLLVDDTFVTKVIRETVTALPKRAQERLIKKEVKAEVSVKEEPKKDVKPVVAPKVEAPKTESPKVETPKVETTKEPIKPVEVKPEEPKKVVKQDTKSAKEDQAVLTDITVTDSKSKKATKL